MQTVCPWLCKKRLSDANMYTVCRRLRVNYLQAILGTEQQLRVGGGGGAGRREVVEPEMVVV